MVASAPGRFYRQAGRSCSLVALLAFALFASGCPKDDPQPLEDPVVLLVLYQLSTDLAPARGSCSYLSTRSSCVNFVSGYTVAEARQGCTGSFSTAFRCAASSSFVGVCAITSGGKSFQTVYYSIGGTPWNLTTSQQDCLNYGGTFSVSYSG